VTRGFYIVLLAQFLSALADNALLFAAIGLLMQAQAPASFTPLLQQTFVVAYIVLAPFVGPFADALPKGRVMFIGNALKLAGAAAMLFTVHPLLAYGLVGVGAAIYSPAKYGILTELLPPQQLVAANGWMEGATVAAIVLGAVCGGALINPALSQHGLALLGLGPVFEGAQFAILVICLLYLLAAAVNLYIPHLAIDHKLPSRTISFVLIDFWQSFKLLWKDPLGQVSLAVTTLFWGVGATLRLVIIAWAAANLNFSLDQATQLTGIVAIGIALGAAIAGRCISLEKSVRVLPAGIVLGFLPIGLIFVHDFWLAALLLLSVGLVSGFFVVPLNALLQHRGHLLMGAGHSIAQQNFNENIGILILIGVYALMVDASWSIHLIMLVFGLFISSVMTLIWRRHRDDVVR
jgi:MFS family permease